MPVVFAVLISVPDKPGQVNGPHCEHDMLDAANLNSHLPGVGGTASKFVLKCTKYDADMGRYSFHDRRARL